ncbi:MAG: DUF1330 domain-containing protein [Rhizobiaceae bacterium]|nr:DUF1330 domain-containing protein [Rhizobiaceae bacterium]
MPKGYWIAHVGAQDPSNFTSDAYQAYVSGARPAFEKYNARFMARGGAFEQMEGDDLGSRHVVIEFDSLDDAKACYNSDIYAEAKKHRMAVSSAAIILIEGIEG